MTGIIPLKKGENITSFFAVNKVRRIIGEKKCGHTGTLDPNATGVLPVLLGCATKAQDLIVNHDKTYIADFRLGITTDTLDIWGKVLTENTSAVTRDESMSLKNKDTTITIPLKMINSIEAEEWLNKIQDSLQIEAQLQNPNIEQKEEGVKK